MKKKLAYRLTLLIAGLGWGNAFGQTHGFVQQDVITISGVTNDQGIATLTAGQKQTTRVYIDGLGRSVQAISIQSSPAQNDIIQPVVYDNLGRQTKSYVSYAGSSSDVMGSFRTNATSAQASYYSNGTADKVADDSAPYSQQVFENSPLQRLLQSGMVGSGFQPGVGGNYSKTIRYRSNNSADGNIIIWGPDGSNLGNYSANQLSVIDALDEDGAESLSFTDLLGRTVLKRQVFSSTVNYDTYYVYNNAGLISYIIPPKATALIIANSYALTQAAVASLLYQYTYDYMGRLVQKTIPSKGLMTIIYDPLNRPLLVQDANLAANHKWNHIKYDIKGRVISQGIFTDTGHDNTNMQSYVNTAYGTTYTYETRNSTSATGYYSNNVFPSTNIQPLAYAYFDDYDLNGNGTADYAYVSQGLANEGAQTTAPIRSMPTMVRSYTVGSGLSEWLLKVMFYDRNGRLIQTQSNNQLKYAAETVTDYKTAALNFIGAATQSLVVKVTGTSPVVTQKVKSVITYDFANRLAAVDQYYNGSSTVNHVSNYTYNEMGQLVDKKLGSSNGTSWLQSVDYRYNIRNQLTSINNSKLTNDGVLNDDSNDLFGMQLYYNTMDGNLSDWGYFNGKLAAVKWMSKDALGNTSNERAFTYMYDAVNRYTAAGYEERSAASTGAFTVTHGWDEMVTGYDANGNIQGLTRNATTQGSGTYTQVDNLTYTYNSTNANQLLSVTDGAGTNYTSTGFRNLTGSTGNYGYDNNGNLNADPYKGMTFGPYNVMNKVDNITFTAVSGRYINYTYDGSGNMIRKQQYDNVSGTSTLIHTTDYIDGFVYVDNTLSYCSMPEGRIMNVSGTLKPEYIITDQQGNARVAFTDNGSGTAVVTQENSYYGFGMVMPGSAVIGDNNRNLYNGGSEWQNDYTNLPDYYQTYYRNYDAAIGRWVGTDPKADATANLTVYQYSNNNPIMYNDPLGDLFTVANVANDPQENSQNHSQDFNQWENEAILEGSGGLYNTNRDAYWDYYLSGGLGGNRVNEAGPTSSGSAFYYDLTGRLTGVMPNGGLPNSYNQEVDDFDGFLHQISFANYNSLEMIAMNMADMDANQGSDTPDYDAFNRLNSTVGATTILGLTGASVGYLKAGSASLKWYSSGWTGGSRAIIKTAQLSKIAESLGRIGVGAGFLFDTYEVVNGNITISHYVTNVVMGAIALTPIGFVTIPYFLIDAYYPGGFEAAMRNAAPLYNQMNQPNTAPPQVLMGMP